MLKEIIGAHVEEVVTRIYHRQDPEFITKDLLKRRIITKDLYEKVLGHIKSVHEEFEAARKT
jgi:hypothetical protein